MLKMTDEFMMLEYLVLVWCITFLAQKWTKLSVYLSPKRNTCKKFQKESVHMNNCKYISSPIEFGVKLTKYVEGKEKGS